MPVEAIKEREKKVRKMTPVPFSNILYKYLVEILVFIIIIILLLLKNEYISDNILEVLLMYLGIIVGRAKR